MTAQRLVQASLLIPVRAATTALLSALAFAAPAQGYDSPFPSTVGSTIGNSHLVARGKGLVFRGSLPSGKIDELFQLSPSPGTRERAAVTDVVIFRNETRNGEVAKEQAELARHADRIDPKRVHTIPFQWKDVQSFETACRQTIEALQVLAEAYETKGRAAYFHCTAGEDRTGLLAGLFQLLVTRSSVNFSVNDVFESEMCQNGYEHGNPFKPMAVVKTVRDELTPVFLRMAWMIEQRKLALDDLDFSVCKGATADASERALTTEPAYAPASYACKPSPLARKAK